MFLRISPSDTKLNPICRLLALLGAHHILHVSRVRVNTDMESFICNDRDLEVFWIRDVTIIWSTMPKMYEGVSKSKVNFPIEALQSTHWEPYRLSKCSHDQSVSVVASVVFVYTSSLKMVALPSNCSALEQQAVIHFLGSKGFKHLKPVICNKHGSLLSRWGEEGGCSFAPR